MPLLIPFMTSQLFITSLPLIVPFTLFYFNLKLIFSICVYQACTFIPLSLANGQKKTAYVFGRRSNLRYGIFRLCGGHGLRQQTVSAAKCAGIDAQASQGVQPLVRNGVTQNSPDIQESGLSTSQSAHTPARRVCAPLLLRDYLMEICSPSITMRLLSRFSAASIASLMVLPTRVTPH